MSALPMLVLGLVASPPATTLHPDYPTFVPPKQVEGGILVPTSMRNWVVLDAMTGKPLLKGIFEPSAEEAVSGAAGRVVVLQGPTSVVGSSLEGRPLWRREGVPNPRLVFLTSATAAVASKRAASDYDEELLVLKADDGERQATFNCVSSPSRIVAFSPIGANTSIVVDGTVNENALCWFRSDEARPFRRVELPAGYLTATVLGDRVYVGTGGELWVLSAKTGELEWKTNATSSDLRPWGFPFLAGDAVVYMTRARGPDQKLLAPTLTCVDLRSRKARWQKELQFDAVSALSFGGRIAVMTAPFASGDFVLLLSLDKGAELAALTGHRVSVAGEALLLWQNPELRSLNPKTLATEWSYVASGQ